MSLLLDVKDLTVRFALPKPSMFAPTPHLEAVRKVERGDIPASADAVAHIKP